MTVVFTVVPHDPSLPEAMRRVALRINKAESDTEARREPMLHEDAQMLARLVLRYLGGHGE